ncbi:Alpha/Beta hydrolase protein [Xylariales sp. AK1849]|nr:Alpha/Beta hydrolase protein [Xylariales sp. AK1849]
MAGKASSNTNVLVPDDPRVQYLSVKTGADTYHYMLSSPPSPIATVLLAHGWPDLGMAWRYQVPFLTSLGLRVIIPDMLGYGQTDAPDAVEEYTLKKMSGQMVKLVQHVLGTEGTGEQEKVILGGHDWGAALVWRMAMWHPEIVKAVFGLNVPYMPPTPEFTELEDFVKRAPTFGYQLQLASPVAEQIVDASPERLRQFINGMYGGVKGKNGEYMFSPSAGIIEENLDKVGPSTLMSPEMVDYYVREYSRHGMHGPTNWYRTRKLNFEDEKEFLGIEGGWKFRVPAMVVMGEKDTVLLPRLADGMERWFEGGLKKEVAKGAGHWAMWQDPEAINGYIGEFIQSVLGDAVKGKL